MLDPKDLIVSVNKGGISIIEIMENSGICNN